MSEFPDERGPSGPADGHVRGAPSDSDDLVLVDEPGEHVRRITLNRPAKRNAISTPLRVALLDRLRAHDLDDDVRVTVVRGAGPCFSAGYDLGGGSLMDGSPFHSAPGPGQWARQANDTWFSVWDLAKPVIAQVHGYAIAGGTELASACDLVYVADDARISYPIVRIASPPDWQYHTVLLGMRRAMELMLTGDPMTGEEAARIGWANRAFPADRLEDEVLAIAARVASVPSDLTQINKRSVHRAFDVWGARAAIRAGTELQALAGQSATGRAFGEQALANAKRAARPPQDG
jgi:enoyl-CoA hydratase